MLSLPGFEQFFEACEQRFPEADGMPTPDIAGPALTELADAHGLRIVGPPRLSAPP